MLGDQPALRFEESLYLRMLAEDPGRSRRPRPKSFLRDNSLSAYYDEVAARALMLAQPTSIAACSIPCARSRIRDAIKGLIVNLSDRKDDDAAAPVELPAGWRDAAGAVRRRPRAAG